MEQSPSREIQRSSANQEIPCILWNPKVIHIINNELYSALQIQFIERITLLQYQKLQEHSLQTHVTRCVSRSYLYHRLLHY